jgi:hypothetical protein
MKQQQEWVIWYKGTTVVLRYVWVNNLYML